MGKQCGNGGGSTQVAPWSTGLYNDLRWLAATYLARQPPSEKLEAADLVHEAWLRLVAGKQGWQSRSHFMAAAAQAMRCVLIDHARRGAAIRHGAGWTRVELTGSEVADGEPDEAWLAIDEALDQFAAHHGEESELVKLRYFEGLTLKEAAAALGITPSAAKRSWSYSRSWLCHEIQKARDESQGPHA